MLSRLVAAIPGKTLSRPLAFTLGTAAVLAAIALEIVGWHDRGSLEEQISFLILAVFAAALLVANTRKAARIDHVRAAEQATRESEARYRLLADNATDMIFILDRNLARRYISPSSLELLGYGAEELIGTIPLQMTHPDDIDYSDDLYGKLFAGELEQAEMIKRVRHRDGRWIWVELTLRLVRDRATAAPVEICGTLRDISRRIAAEHAQREAEGNFRLLAERVGDVVVRSSLGGVWQYVSPAATRVFGVPAASLVGKSAAAFVHPEDRPAMLDRVRRLRAGIDETVRPVFRIVRPDGTVRSLEASTHIVFDQVTDEPAGYVSVLRDVTERLAAEAASREREESYRLLLQSSVVSESIYMMDEDGRLKSWNLGAERLYGYGADEVVGQYYGRFFTPEDNEAGKPAEQLTIARETGQFDSEAVRQRRDGSRFRARVKISAVRRDDGTLRGYATMVRDITGEKIEQEQREIISEAAPNPMLIVDETGAITLANAALERLFGYNRADLIGQPVERLLDGGIAPGAAATQEAEGRRSDGTRLKLELMLSPVQTAAGRIVVASLFDLSERKRLQSEQLQHERHERQKAEDVNANLDRLSRHLAAARDRAERASRAKTRFLSGMSHELRTPLNGILGYARLLQMEANLDPKARERVEAMIGAGRHLLEMITCILDLSEIESGHIALKPTRVHLESLAAAALDLVRPAADGKDLALHLDVEPAAAPAITTDSTRLRQILLNLLGNAVKFTAAGTVSVHIRAAAFGAAVRLEVADTGRGIAADQRRRLFGEFERLRAEDEEPVEGAGLGLALSHRLAAAMGGTLGFEDNPAGGSLFWLQLPIGAPATPPAAAEPAAPEDAVVAAPASSLRVLVVDDVAMNRDVAAAFLARAGHAPTVVDGAAAALDALAAHPVDVVLMDIQMPGIDGLEATRRIRAIPGPAADVPVIAVTAQAFADQLAACRAAGMTDHVTKPFDPDTLVAAVVRAAATRQPQHAAPQQAPPQQAPSQQAPAEPGPPLFDPARFEVTAGILDPAAVSHYLAATAALARELAASLGAGAEPDALADMAHRLAGSAGMFGFDRLAAAARRLETSLLGRAADGPAARAAAADVIAATLPRIAALQPSPAVTAPPAPSPTPIPN